MKTQELRELLEKLVKLPKETEWVEFKLNYHSMNEIGERISALSNGACLFNQQNAYLTFGIADENQNIIGTSFKPFQLKKVRFFQLPPIVNRQLVFMSSKVNEKCLQTIKPSQNPVMKLQLNIYDQLLANYY